MRPLAVAGNVNVDLIMGPFEPWPKPGSEVLAAMDAVRPGGAAGNVALAWQAFGVPHAVAANTGNDLFGDFLRKAFPETQAAWPRATSSTTLSVGITHPDGERTFFTSRGHLADLTFCEVRAALDPEKLRGGLLLLCGSFLTPALTPAYGELFDWADEHGIDIVLDTGWPPDGWTGEIIAMTRAWLPRCRHLLLNEAEACALGENNDAVAAARNLAGILAEDGVVAVKQGADGATAATADGSTTGAAGRRVDVIDTIGAGDVFNAGYLLSVALGRPIAAALEAGIEAASIAISTNPRRYMASDLRLETLDR